MDGTLIVVGRRKNDRRERVVGMGNDVRNYARTGTSVTKWIQGLNPSCQICLETI